MDQQPQKPVRQGRPEVIISDIRLSWRSAIDLVATFWIATAIVAFVPVVLLGCFVLFWFWIGGAFH